MAVDPRSTGGMMISDRSDGDEAELLPRELVLSLARSLREQAGKLRENARKSDGFQKPVADGVSAIVKAAVSLADLVATIDARQSDRQEDELIDIRSFFAAADERIDELAAQRAAQMVAERTLEDCPSCGARFRPAGAA